MFWVSLLTMPFGLTEPLFVPEYWNPPSLFNLAAKTGFDIESFLFSFAVGGIGAVLYETVFKVKHQKMDEKEMHMKKHRFHKLAVISPVLAFIPLYFLTDLNPIYSASIAMFVGGVATYLCRRDLKKNILIGGVLFTGLYFIFFLGINLVFPDFIDAWNFSTISGMLVLGVPLEELMFAFTFGMIWSSIYEHVFWYRS
jgi:nicotinamide riboside transporter PnuC